MDMNIAVIKGDGIGPEVISQAIRVLKTVCEKYNYAVNFTELLAGGAAIDATGTGAPEHTINTCKKSDAVLLGALGGPKWDHLNDRSLLIIRKELGLFANIRPVILFEELKDICPIKDNFIKNDLNFIIFRELTSGIYFGRKEKTSNYACDCMEYYEYEIERIAHKAFAAATGRSKKLTSVDKANVLETSKLWRRTVDKISKQYPQVKTEHLYVDNAAMQLIRNPAQFDVILTENMFGDILSDEASMISGSIGMLPSASMGEGDFGLYEPSHGTAPDIAGQNIANPIASILSAALMLRYTFKKSDAADNIENAVKKALAQGYRTADIANGKSFLGTKEITDKIISYI
ncbi:MAG: 3-isopropylmalate dehydrogenase [Eubacteriaceae bacterium]|nr:3-isopropylmalate dehydrogenase [Eubacteriaceae bacterium]